MFLYLAAFRIANALLLQTYFQPDEFWQGVEPAHAFVFGYGGLTWDWVYFLRSSWQPMAYAAVYTACDKLGLGHDWIVALPQALNGLVAAIGEYYLYHYTLRKSGDDRSLAKCALWLSVFSVWNCYVWPRGFANSWETSFTVVALYWLECGMTFKALCLAAITCCIRPTSAIVWLCVFVPLAMKRPSTIVSAVAAGSLVLGLDSLINHSFYGRWVFPLVNFYNFNYGSGLSSFYGVSRLDFYFDQAIPILLMHYLPMFLYGLKFTPLSDILLSVIYLLVLTTIQHKEFRFIYPLMPLFLQSTARGVLAVRKKIRPATFQRMKLITIAVSLALAYYFTRVHESGEYLMPFRIRDHVINSSLSRPVSVGYLTPCHSTPYQSHIHLPPSELDIWYVSCLPPLHGEDLQTYMDDSDHLFENPIRFFLERFPAFGEPCSFKDHLHCWPNFIVIFQPLWDREDVHEFLTKGGYHEAERLSNAKFHWDHRRLGDILLLEK